jgi:hypothetical protein
VTRAQDPLEAGRAAYQGRDWSRCWDLLGAADRDTPLAAADLSLLAISGLKGFQFAVRGPPDVAVEFRRF